MRKIRPLLFMLLACLPAHAQPPPFAVNRVFGPGEKFVFEVKYGFIHGGFGKLEVLDTVRIRGNLCFQVRAVAHSNATLSFVFPVRDTNLSFIDVNGLYSHEMVKIIREGSYKRYRTMEFNHQEGVAVTTDYTVRKDSTVKIPPYLHDILSAFYYFRTLKVADSVDIKCLDDYQTYPLRIRIIGKESIKTPLGKFSCIVVDPQLASSGIFMKKGRMTLWMTDDERRLPVLVKFKLSFLGNISCYLTDYSPPDIIPQNPPDTLPAKPATSSDSAKPQEPPAIRDTTPAPGPPR
jgi:hypothetical protein